MLILQMDFLFFFSEQLIEVKWTRQTIAILMQYSKCEQAKTNQIIWTPLHSKCMIFAQKMLFGWYYCSFYIHGHTFKWDNLYYIRIVLWIFHFFISCFVNDNSSKFIALFTSQNFRIIYNTSRSIVSTFWMV